MSEKEEQYRKINEIYNDFTLVFYERMRRSEFRKKDLDKQIDRLITSLKVLKEM